MGGECENSHRHSFGPFRIKKAGGRRAQTAFFSDEVMASAQHVATKKLLIVVLHMIYPDSGKDPVEHTMGQCQVAVENGADGVAVITGEHRISDAQLEQTADRIKSKYPQLVLIINYMCPTHDAMTKVPDFADGLWTDKGVDGRGCQSRVEEGATIRASRAADWSGRWFAGFFHKGGDRQLPEDDAALQALADQFLALHPSVIPTTTGAGTGIPADIPALARLFKAIGGRKPMAIASGVDAQNVHAYLPYIDYFFVATGIEQPCADPSTIAFYESAGLPLSAAVSIGHLDPIRVRALADAIHSYAQAAF